jgi:hypothetical protein
MTCAGIVQLTSYEHDGGVALTWLYDRDEEVAVYITPDFVVPVRAAYLVGKEGFSINTRVHPPRRGGPAGKCYGIADCREVEGQ